ncbi:MAG: DeoR/GlpR transcriptional regulator [Candidimonas sp.]|nr:MAG: DeoR/GlpR transcriptional regulator [Candidimonas sp.]
MTPNPRQQHLLRYVRERQSSTVDELATRLGVTAQTIRRDARRMAEAGLLARFHGGVSVPGSTTENLAYTQRENLNAAGKRRIADVVARAVPNGCSLFINIGTTTEAIARALMRHTGLRVITNDLNVAVTLSRNHGCEVIVAGGVVRPRDGGIIGEATIDFIRQFKVDIALIGISSIEADGSLRDYDYREVKVSQAIIAHAREVWLAADMTKFNRQAMVKVVDIAQIDRLFTDAAPPSPFPQLLAQANVHCEIAAGSKTEPT